MNFQESKSIDTMIHEFMLEENIPGLAMAIVQAPYIPRIVSYGLADVQFKRLASSKTLWAIGPISQAFTAIAILQLVEQNKISFKDRLSQFIAETPMEWHQVTILQLLQHASGIADYRLQSGYDPAKNYTSTDLISSVKMIPLSFTPGTKVSLSATNFLLLADIIESVSQMPYKEFIKKNQLAPLGLQQTCFADDFPSIKQENINANQLRHHQFLSVKEYIDPTENALGYNQELKALPVSPSAALKGFGDIWASAENVSIWDIALAGSILIQKPENRAILYSPTKLDNGTVIPAIAGWQFPRHKGFMESKGSIPGFSSFLSRFTDPSELVCVTLLANKEGVDFTNLARRIASLYGSQLSSDVNDDELYAYESIFSVSETIKRIEDNLKAHNIPIFATFDHGKNAKEVGLELRPTQVIVFGSPSVGTKLMQENQSISIDLPLKIAVWEDLKGSTWLAFPHMDKLAFKYSNLDKTVIANMQKLLEKIAKTAANIY